MKFEETMLSGYIDGELTDEERGVVERRLAESPKDRELLKSLTELHKKLTAMPEEIFLADPVAGVRKRIAEQRAQGERTRGADASVDGAAAGNFRSRSDASTSNSLDPSPPQSSAIRPQVGSSSLRWLGLLAAAASVLIVAGLWVSQRAIPLAVRESRTTGDRAPAPGGIAMGGGNAGDATSGESGQMLKKGTDGDLTLSAEQNAEPEDIASAGLATDTQADDVPLEVASAIEASAIEASAIEASASMVADVEGEAENSRAMMAAMPAMNAARSAHAEPMDRKMARPLIESFSTVYVFRFDSKEEAERTGAEDVDANYPMFDGDRAIGLEVPEGWTDDALRLIGDWMAGSAMNTTGDSGAGGFGENAGPAGTKFAREQAVEAGLLKAIEAADADGGSGASVAVLIDAPPEKLAGLIQSMRTWSREAAGATNLNREIGDFPLRVERSMASADSMGGRSDALPQTRGAAEMGAADEGLRLGAEIAIGVREGRIWIVIEAKPSSPE